MMMSRSAPGQRTAAEAGGIVSGFGDEYLKLGAIKIIQDGSNQGYTGHFTEPYHTPFKGDPDYRGYPRRSREDLTTMVKELHEAGYQIAIHANGDAGIDDVLHAFREAQRDFPREDARHRIEHCQMVRKDQLDAIAELNLSPSFFVGHVYYWGDRHRDIFMGPERAAGISALRSSIDRGIRFTVHDDTPVIPVNPLQLVWVGVNRLTKTDQVLGPDERITPLEALRTVTIDAAWQNFEEDIKGSIAPGKLADLVSLDGNPLTVDPTAIRELVAAIYAETEGNPFFVEEVFQHLSEEGRLFDEDGQWRVDLRVEDLEVPEGIRLMIGRRIERLSAEARRVLTTAATVGRSFDLTLLAAAGDVEGDALLTALEEAESARLVQTVSSGREVRWEFAHGLIRQTLESSLSLMRRQRAHLRVAEAMERVYGTRIERHAADVAQHLYQAGMGADLDKTVRFLSLAGDQALESGAFDEALRQFENALSVQAEADQRQFVDLHYKKGAALRSLGRGDEAIEEWLEALSGYEKLGDVEGIARTVFNAAWETSWLPMKGQFRAAQALARRGLDAVGDGDAAARCRLLAVLSTFSAVAGDDYQVVHDPLREAEELAETVEDPALTAELLHARARIHWSYMQLPKTNEAGRRCRQRHEERGELYDAWEVLGASWFCGHLRETLEQVHELETLAARVGHVYGQWVARCWAPTLHHLVTTGDLAQSAARARRDIEYAERAAPTFRFANHATRGVALFYAGDWTAARSEFDTAVRLDLESFLVAAWPAWVLLARAYAGESDALDLLLADRSRLLAMPDENPFGVWEQLLNVVEGLAVFGQRTDAADLYPLVLRGIEKGVVISWQLRLWQMVAGIAASYGEHWDTAQEHFETALTQAHDLPHKIAQPETRRWYAQMLIDRNVAGDRDKARTLLGEAVEMYRTIGMPKHLEMAERMLV